MKKLQLLTLALSALCTSACSNVAEETNSDNTANATDSVGLAIPLRSDLFSEQEIDKMDHNYAILIEHIKISDDSTSYYLDISEEEAIKLTVDKEYYQSTAECIRQTNIVLKEAFERGDDIELTDFQNLQLNH